VHSNTRGTDLIAFQADTTRQNDSLVSNVFLDLKKHKNEKIGEERERCLCVVRWLLLYVLSFQKQQYL